MKTKTLAIVVASLGGALFAHAQATGGAAGTGTAGASATPGGTPPTSNTGLPAGPTTNAGTPLPGNLDPAANLNPPVSGTSRTEGMSPVQSGPLISTPAAQIPGTAPGTTPRGPQPTTDVSTPSPGNNAQMPTATGGTSSQQAALPSEMQIPTQIGAPGAVVVPSAPPPPRVEARSAMPASPGLEHTWVPGHYAWLNRTWTWVSGQWAIPPQRGLMWVPGQFDPQGQRWVEGHWESDPDGSVTR